MSSSKRKKTPGAASTSRPPDNDEKTPCPRPKKKSKTGSISVKPRPTSFLSLVLSSANSDVARGQESHAARIDVHRGPTTAQTSNVSLVELLPDEVLGKCFFSGFVNSIDIITNVSMVSKRTRAVASKSVKMLDLRALPKLEAHHVGAIVARHGNLSSLDFGYCAQFGREHLMELVPLSETLRALNLRGTNVRDADIVAYLDAVQEHLGGLPSGLEELDLSAIKKEESPRIGDETVYKISGCCPHLKSLQLGWCKGITDECLPSLKFLRRLGNLDLSLTSITDKGCSDLADIHELQSLDLSATGLGDEGIRNLLGDKLSRPSQLAELSLRFNSDLTEESLSLLATRLPSLKSLDVRHCELNKNDAKEIAGQLKRNGTLIRDE